ncbi:MAG: hypothetical protein ACXVB5_22405, partial [Isosphaeraceae bacterium]
MRQALVILIFIAMSTLGVKPAQAQANQNLRAWWAGGEIGEGQLSLSSDQIHRKRTPTFALGFFGGHRLGDRARVGLEVNGWLLQASNLNDPTVGEGVSNVLGVIDLLPTRKIPLFIRGGGGLAMYQNNRPQDRAAEDGPGQVVRDTRFLSARDWGSLRWSSMRMAGLT